MQGECDRVPLVILQDGQDHTSCKVQYICLESKLTIVVGVSEDRSSGETVLELSKGLGLSSFPSEHFVLLGQVHEWLCELSIVFDEVSIEVGETEEAVNAMDSCQHRPLHNGFHLGVIHLNAIMVDKHPKVFNFSFVK